MADIELVDVSLRDGNQSLWGAVGVTTRMQDGAVPLLDAVGYRCIELLSSTAIAVAVRFHREDPWERMRRASAAAARTPLGFLTSGKRFITFYRTPEPIFELAFDLLVRNGISRMWVIDPLHDMDSAKRTAALAKKAGFAEVIGGLCYTLSPVHDDRHYAEKGAELDDCDDIDGIYLKDPAGLLTPDRLRTLVPGLHAATPRHGVTELHSHATTGLSPLVALEAADMGFRILHTALPPLANGSSHPAAQRTVANLAARGHRTRVDLDAMEAASAYLTRQARLKRLPAGTPHEYDESYYRHNIPGGLQSTLRRQLRELGREDLYDAVIEESVQVRAELGWPIVMTPFAQYIVTQATLNVLGGKRWEQVSNEVVDLLRGEFGPLPGAPDPQVLDRALATTRARRPAGREEEVGSVSELRRRFGARLSDEELLLRAVMPAEQVDAMVAARAAGGVRGLLAAVAERPTVIGLSVSNGTQSVALRTRAAR